MALDPNNLFGGAQRMTRGQAQAAEVDVGLREYMLKVYNYMTSGLALTGLLAYVTANTPALLELFYSVGANGRVGATALGWIVMLSPLAFILVLNFGIGRMKASTAQFVFWAFAAVMGLSLSNIFLMYTGVSITRVFFITAATFAAMSIYGYTTKRDLTQYRSFLMMGLFGIIIASVVNIFLQSSGLHFVISIIGVLVFVGLTAHDTQNIRNMYYAGDHSETATKKAVMGALSLYLDFLNLFLLLLHLFGDRR
jgi:FtsH-binding integral membrane protein